MIWFVLIYIIGGFLSTGISFATLQRAYPILANKDYSQDMSISWLFFITGPFMGVYILCDNYARQRKIWYGLKYW